jgi:hypothetical protein
MTSAAVLEQLSRPLERFGDLPELNDAEEHLMRHMLVGAALLPGHAERFRALRRRWDAEGPSDELRADALDAAGDLGAVLQGAAREEALAVGLADTALAPTRLLGALEQLFYSLVILTETETDDVRVAMSSDELDDLLAMPGLEDWLDPESALRRGARP